MMGSARHKVRIVDGSFVAVVDFLVGDCVAVEFDGFVRRTDAAGLF